MLSFCRNNNLTIDFYNQKNIFLYSLMHPNPLSLVITSGLVSRSPFPWYPSTVNRTSYLKAHLNTPFSMDTFERLPICRRQILHPGLCSLGPYSGTLASLSSPISQHSSNLTWLTGNTAQSIQFHRYIPLPRKAPPFILYSLSWVPFSLTLSPPFGTKHSSSMLSKSTFPWHEKLLHTRTVWLGHLCISSPRTCITHSRHAVNNCWTERENCRCWIFSLGAVFCTILNICLGETKIAA